jgi:hypothetical protein
MKKGFIFKHISFLIMVVLFLFTGCTKEPGEDFQQISLPDGLKFNWISSWDSFTVTSLEYAYYGDTTRTSLCMRGDILEVWKKNGTGEGYLVLLIQESSSSCGSWGSDYSYFVPGNYTVVRWNELTASSVKAANAYKDGGGIGSECFASKETAVNEMIKNINAPSTYFSYMGSYNRE